eukprot:g10177.t1
MAAARARLPRAAGSGLSAARRKPTPSRFFDLAAALASVQMPEDLQPRKPSLTIKQAVVRAGPTRSPSPCKTPSPQRGATSDWRKRTVSCARAAIQHLRAPAEEGFQAFLENGQVKAGKMKDLLGCLATSPLTPKERFEVLGALQQTEEGRLGRMVELNGHHLLCQWIFKDEVPVARAALGLLKRLKFKERPRMPEKLKLMELLERLPREELTPQVAACRKKWKLAPKPKPAPCTAHTAAVDQLGGLFTWGQGSYGRCGHGVGTDMPSPARVESLSGLSMSQVALGLMHSVTKSVKGQLYSWGKGPATGFDVADVITTPRQVKLDLRDPVYQIAAGPLHTVVLMQNGSVIYFGSGTEGRLPYRNNLDGSLEDVPAPTLLKPPELKAALLRVLLLQLQCRIAWLALVALVIEGDTYVDVYHNGRLDQPPLSAGPRQLNCRYHVPGDTVVGNLPAAETANAGDVNDTAPLLNVTALEISTSVTKILFNVEREANIYCGVIDARYELRFSASELNATVLQRVQVNTLEDCEARCIARDLCVAMEFYVVGQDVISGTNCKLLQDEYDTNNRFPESPIASFTQKYKYLAKPEHTITISGLLFPNTVYNTYCSAEDPVTLVHSNWSAIGRTYQTARTETLGLVASASQPGRIFCNAFEVNASQAPTISGELIREPNIFAILTSTGASISLTLGNLLPETEYHVACMAESDGGTESVLQQMEARYGSRPCAVPREDSTISSMRIVRDRLMFWDEITVSTQLISIGYLWCQVFPTENIRELGLPTAESLKEGDNLKVADLQELSSVTFSELDPNTSYDVWCTSEYNDFRDDQAGQDLLTPFPKSTVLSIDSSYYTADVLVYLTKGPADFGMDPPSILETRTQLLTQGPFFDDLGWSCVSGRPCNVSDLLGVGLSKHDGLFVRADGCPERCRCSGVADPLSKGAECTPISQDVTVQAGVGLSDAKDLRGSWCYVAPGACRDEEVSQVFPQMMLSYQVCSYLLEAGSGTVVSGFPNGGLSQTFDGRSFSWGDGPVVAVGRTYDLCWCNGTASSCTLEADFSVRLGPLHFGGPSTEQAQKVEVCRAGMPCVISGFEGQAIESLGVPRRTQKGPSANGSRLVVLPLDPRGCLWQRVSQADSPGLTDFPNLGVSETFDEITRSYHFFGVPLIARGGRYDICWCGPPPDGGHFLSPAGVLQLLGPSGQPETICRLGVSCVVPQVIGEGLQGSDRVAALQQCGQPANPPLGWQQGAEALGTDRWTSAGWLSRGPSLSHEMLQSFGALARSVFIRETTFLEGAFSIRAYDSGGTFLLPPSVQSVSYQVCWCAAEQTCANPRDFTVSLGIVDFGGPLPDVVYRCFEWEPCEIPDLEGTTLGDGDRLLVVPDGTNCLDLVNRRVHQEGFPFDGISLPATSDGKRYSWGSGLVRAAPGFYALCCPPRAMDPQLSWLLAVPLPALFFGAICLGIARVRGRRGGREAPEAPPLRQEVSAQLSAQRLRSMMTLDAKETGFGGGRHSERHQQTLGERAELQGSEERRAGAVRRVSTTPPGEGTTDEGEEQEVE